MTDRLPQQAVAQKFLESLKAGFAWPLVAWTRGPNLCGVKEFSVMSSCYGLCKFAMLLYMKPWQKVSSIHIVPVLLGLMAFQWPFAIAVLIESHSVSATQPLSGDPAWGASEGIPSVLKCNLAFESWVMFPALGFTSGQSNPTWTKVLLRLITSHCPGSGGYIHYLQGKRVCITGASTHGLP